MDQKLDFNLYSFIIIVTQLTTLVLIIMTIATKKNNPRRSKKISDMQTKVHLIFMIEISILLLYLCNPFSKDTTNNFIYYKQNLFVFAIFTLINAILTLINKPVTCQQIMKFVLPSSVDI